MIQTNNQRTTPTTHRIDLPCELAGFSRPPFDVHLKVLPGPADGGAWTLLAHSSPGEADILARWLAGQTRVEHVHIGPGLAPRLLRATLTVLPPVWSVVASSVKVHHLDIGADGFAAWFVECTRDQVLALKERLEPASETGGKVAKPAVRGRPVPAGRARLSRRQSEALCTAVSLGYYEIPHRIDMRALAKATGVSLGSISELLRRAEATILTHYVDSTLLGWPTPEEDELREFRPTVEPFAPMARRAFQGRLMRTGPGLP